MAEGEGFEPPETCASTVFKTAAFDHSAIPPYRRKRCCEVYPNCSVLPSLFPTPPSNYAAGSPDSTGTRRSRRWFGAIDGATGCRLKRNVRQFV